MRPVNLIPPEDRRGDRAPSRTGALPYIVIGALVAAVAAVAAVVLTNNQISAREGELASVKVQADDAQARADALRPYAEFAAMAQARAATVSSLATSRFDWDRALRELALVLPDSVWLTQLSGTVSPEVSVASAAEVSVRADAQGPALSIVGCADGHQSVAEFLQALKDIDGVTRVGIVSSAKATDDSSAGGGGGDVDCRTRDFITQFQIVAAFDEVTVPPVEGASTAAGDQGVISDAQQQEQQVRDSTAQQTEKAQRAVNVIPGVAR
jgi:Tfp pilus assembly protein PilN